MKSLLRIATLAGLLSLAVSLRAQADTAPKSVIHVVTVAWKDGTTAEQIQAALDGVKTLAASYSGIKHVWIRSIKVQNPPGAQVQKSHAFVMEFADEAALKAYTDSDAQKAWYKLYLPIRQQSTTYDITN
ncbi:MAG TPA: Dabb family protein [Opitutus sp.]|nr:Dabb family protein [Opitutus sp.]